MFSLSLAQISNLRSNDRICGMPNLPHGEETIVDLASQTQQLEKITTNHGMKNFQIGERTKFYTYNFDTEEYIQLDATLRASESNINIWVEDNEWTNYHVTQSAIQGIIRSLLYETPGNSVDSTEGILNIIHSNFGFPPDFDGDGITDFLVTDIRDGWEEGEGFIAGYFNPIDQYNNGTPTSNGEISNSNERDMLYIDSYPGTFRNDNGNFEQVLGTVSHEYQHLVQFNYDRMEETWVNEGLSELSSFLCGYGLRNPSAYLFDTGLELTAWEDEIQEALKHYAKTALWTYYLYEQFGADLIKNIVQSNLPGPSGISNAFSMQGYFISFKDAMLHFFNAITLNDSRLSSLYQFQLPDLVGLQAQPHKLINDYPTDLTATQDPNSLLLYTFENGDSLDLKIFNFNSNMNLYVIKLAQDSTIYKETLNSDFWYDDEFGSTWLQERLMVVNTSDNSDIVALNANAKQKRYFVPLEYYTGSPVYNITSDGSINANTFNVPYDSCLLKSVIFYNFESSGEVRIHVYLDELRDGTNPESKTKKFQNILQGNWVTLDLEDLHIVRNSGETFDIGIEYLTGGVMGYSTTPANLNKSYLKQIEAQTFRSLNNFEINQQTLQGVWMININYLAPLRHKPVQNETPPYMFTLERVGPTPFPVPGNPNLRIQYTLEKAGNLKIEMYDILGQKVATIFDGYDRGPIGVKWWDGRNQVQEEVASGQYFLNFSFEGQSEVRKILVLR
jgi:hypothetical protein